MPKVTKQVGRKRKGPVKGPVSRIQSLGSGRSEGIHINLYGRTGTGKTTLWATFPKPILALIVSGGSEPGELKSVDTKEYRKTIKWVSLRSSDEVSALVQYQAEQVEFSTLVLDHASGLQDLILKEVLGLEKIPEQLSWGLATREQYGQVALQMKERLRSLLNLPCNIVIVAQEREFNTEGGSDLLLPYVASALTPSVVGWLNPAVDYICQTFIRPQTKKKRLQVGKKVVEHRVPTGKVEYALRTAPHSVFTTKFRVPKRTELPDVIINPNYNKLITLIQGGR